jgi:hypothetical protein
MRNEKKELGLKRVKRGKKSKEKRKFKPHLIKTIKLNEKGPNKRTMTEK